MRFWLVAALLSIATAPGVAAAAEMVHLMVTPSMPEPGALVVISFELRNPENRPLLAGVVDVRAAGKSIAQIATPPLPAGGSTRVSQGVTLPNVAAQTLRLVLQPPSGQPPASITLTLAPRP
jgi:hypothetical protein